MLEHYTGPLKYDFVRRKRCPVCEGCGDILYSCRYRDEPVSKFIAWRYGRSTASIGVASYILAECARCALLYQVEVGGPRFIDDLYREWIDDPSGPEDYATYRRDIARPLESRDAHEIIAAASYLRVPLKQTRTLDFGMGWGLWAETSRTLGCDSWGTDLSATRRAFVAERGVTVIENHEIPEGYFHFVNTEQVMEHLVEPYAQADVLARSLLPGGILKISVPSADPVNAGDVHLALGGNDVRALMAVHPLEHINGFRKKTLAVLAERLGLQIVKPGYFHRFAFLHHSGAIRLNHPKQAAKELIRPFVQWRMPWNLYVWLRKPSEARSAAAKP
jgi:hypothetical protein